MEKFLQDVRYGVRGFIRQPSFTLTAILALALGIGANTAVFSVVYGVLVKPLPYPEPDRVVFIEDTYAQVRNAAVSFPKLVALREGTQTLAALGGYTPVALTLTGGGDPEQVSGVSATAEIFSAVGVQPVLGRWFTAEEDTPNGPKTVMLAESLWRRRYAADPKIIGKVVQVNGVPHTVVGIMPREASPSGQAWVPMALAPGTAPGGNFMRLLGRMKPGVTVEQVQQDLNVITEDFNRKNGLQRNVAVFSMKEAVIGDNRRILLLLQVAVAFVLLVACANVANLLLARSVVRQRELAIRAAVGAGRGRLVRQMLTESAMLSIAGGLAGVLLGSWLLRLFLRVVPPSFPRVSAISLDAGVLVFTVLVATVTGLLFGLVPARQGFKTDPNESLRDTGARGATAAGTRGVSRVLVVAEIALALVLVIGAGLLVKSLLRLQAQETGFMLDNVFTFNLNLPSARYDGPATGQFYAQLVEQVRAIPGVQAASAISFAPLTNWGFNGVFTVQGQPPIEQSQAPITEFRFVTPGYFDTMRIRFAAGSDFTARNDSSDRPVVIISESMARKYFGGADAIGGRIWLAIDPPATIREVVGVVADVRDATLDRAPANVTFVPHAQVPRSAMGIMVRTGGDIGMDAVLPAIRTRIAKLDPNVPIVRPQTMETAVEASTSTERMTSVLTSVFALVAGLLASLGVYSLIAYSVAQRTREIGIRVALGASRNAVLGLVMSEGLMLAAIGVVIGVPGAFVLTRFLKSLLYEVSPSDPLVVAATCAGVLLVALLASVIPALRALRIDPMIALRGD